MRIAMLAPISWPLPPAGYGPWEQVAYNLTEELVNLGHEVTLFAAGGSKVRLVPENRAYSERTVDLQTEVVQLHPVVATTRIISQNGQ